MNAEGDICKVCGGSEMNLVDGFYYCVECGTQDENYREMVVDHTIVNDVIMRTATKKIAKQHGPEMTPEWYKWHTYNFILSELADEVIALGAKPSFKVRLLWIWCRYIKLFQLGEDGKSLFNKKKGKGSDKNQNVYNSDNESIESDDDQFDEMPVNKEHANRMHTINTMVISVMYAMIYVALNLDNSDIQLYHIMKYARDDKIASGRCLYFIPKEMKVDEIPSWNNFAKSVRTFAHKNTTRLLVVDCLDKLKLGTFRVPDIKKLVVNFLKELSLPNDFKKLVYSLIDKLNHSVHLKNVLGLTYFTDYDALAMAYIILALKICFGLDEEYEIILSDAVEKENEINNHARAYTFDMFNDETNRLFSFREWTYYLQLRKKMLCKYYSAHALQYDHDMDDYLFIAQNRYQPKVHRMKDVRDISHEVTMDIINKLESQNESFNKFKINFPPSLTPMSTYSEIVSGHVEDPDLKLILSEDFSKYSLKYILDLKLPHEEKDNVIIGVSKDNKIINRNIEWDRSVNGFETNMVYVRNCDNKNWMRTNPPEAKHISNENFDESIENINILGSEYSYDSDKTSLKEENIEIITDEFDIDTNYSIFDDVFESDEISTDSPQNDFGNEYESYDDDEPLQNNENNLCENKTGDFSFREEINEISEVDSKDDILPFDFDRERAIKELVTITCKKHKITIPKEYKPIVSLKRKTKNPTQAVEAKKRKISRNDKTNAQAEINELINTYNSRVVWDILKTTIVDLPNDSINGTDLSIKSNNEDNHNDINVVQNTFIDTSVIFEDPHETNGQSDTVAENPDFNENIYEIKQLYVKCKDGNKEAYLDDDRNLDELLSSIIEKVPCSNNQNKILKSNRKPKLSEHKKFLFRPDRNERVKSKLKGNFNYWMRYYSNKNVFYHNKLSRNIFEEEIDANLPKTFFFILQMCSVISESPMITIYRCLNCLEKIFCDFR